MAALEHSPDVFETFFDSAQIGLALADLSGRYVRVNATYAALLGQSPEDLVGVPLSQVVPESALPGAGVDDLLSGAQASVTAEASHAHPDGSVTWLLHGVARVSDAAGSSRWLAVSAQDITERRRVEMELRALSEVLAEQAVRDPLTGLANRALLEERLRASLARDARTGGSTAVLFLDLDGFKGVNDEYGHAVGDEVLRAVAERLSSVVRPSDTVARLGGDEFVVLVESATSEAVEALVPRVQLAVEESSQVSGNRLPVGVSVGVATSQGGDADPAGLIAAADERMYVAKRRR
ncbi:MAG: hypothetical protein JWN08_2238 [Frankiales bacterium]|nr:hypothetical protein [Frankiales bacterium]